MAIAPDGHVVDRAKSYMGLILVGGLGEAAVLATSYASLRTYLESANLLQDQSGTASGEYAQAQSWMANLMTSAEDPYPTRTSHDAGLNMYSAKIGSGQVLIVPAGFVVLLCSLDHKPFTAAYSNFLGADATTKTALAVVAAGHISGAAKDELDKLVAGFPA